jgi:hypothetical protein
LITLNMLGEEYKLWSSSLCSFLHPPDSLVKVHKNSSKTLTDWHQTTLHYNS